ARALGADVTKSDKGWGIGRHDYQIKTRPDWLGDTRATSFALGVSHQDQVQSLVPGAQVVAGTDFCPYAAIDYPAATAISFQGHPEYSPEFACALYGIRKGTILADDKVDAACDSLRQPLDNNLVGAWIARFFSNHAS
ncbi:MAG: glutamine amidotransferase, partial [Henriciella sp.]|nr:glutamine amidotransferase [Henriciella sp.]